MSVLHYLLGYEEVGDRLVFETPIREAVVSDLKRVVEPYDDDPELLDVYQLDRVQLGRIERLIGEAIPTEGRSFFLQAFSEPRLTAKG